MEWTQFIILLVTISSLFFWNRSESNNDRREMANMIREMKQESTNQIAAIQQDVKAIHDEIKDFHGRLCAIEERNRK